MAKFETEYRTVTVKIVDGTTFQGKVNIAPNQRISELFTTQKGQFVVMTDVQYSGGSGKILFINKDHILWVEPED
ncbi:MAG: hypothetical protein C4519_04885 [Desulfobacteraceae bacterium]|nr:MAG: hypothetical protein C4519_04885 [Desulfobacteraceae bacterium]